tara:strand:- start:226 stop:426 length:201 start_codon:yes stop_codon:yes gene_type:complete
MIDYLYTLYVLVGILSLYVLYRIVVFYLFGMNATIFRKSLDNKIQKNKERIKELRKLRDELKGEKK